MRDARPLGVSGYHEALGVETGRPPRILFIRPDHLGDVLLTLPAVGALRRALPGAYLAYAAPPAAAAAARRCPHVDEALAVGFPTVDRRRHGDNGWRQTVRTESRRFAGAFDAALVVRPDDPLSGELVSAAAVPVRVGFDMPRTRRYLTDVLPVPGVRHVALDGFDLADGLLARLGVGGRTARTLDACLVVSRADEEQARRVLLEAGADEGPIVLHPGSGWSIKNWPASRWVRLAAELGRRYGSRPVVAGTAAEKDLVRDVARRASAIDVAGRLSVGALAAVHRRARLVVATDSGAVHLAAAMGTPVVALFGPSDPRRFGPLASPERVRVVRVALPCSPCGGFEHPPCGAAVEPACVTGIGVEPVLRAAAELLRDGAVE